MKKKNFKNLSLNKKSISNFKPQNLKGGWGEVPRTLLCESHSICPPGIHCF